MSFLILPSRTLTKTPSPEAPSDHEVAYHESIPLTKSSGMSTGLCTISSCSGIEQAAKITAPAADFPLSDKNSLLFIFIFSS